MFSLPQLVLQASGLTTPALAKQPRAAPRTDYHLANHCCAPSTRSPPSHNVPARRRSNRTTITMVDSLYAEPQAVPACSIEVSTSTALAEFTDSRGLFCHCVSGHRSVGHDAQVTGSVLHQEDSGKLVSVPCKQQQRILLLRTLTEHFLDITNKLAPSTNCSRTDWHTTKEAGRQDIMG